MVQPKKAPYSIRLGEERLARIDAYAADHKLSRHLAVLLLIDEGYRALVKADNRPKLTELIAGSKPGAEHAEISTGPAVGREFPQPSLKKAAIPYGSRLKKR